jgi:hypothetical protein
MNKKYLKRIHKDVKLVKKDLRYHIKRTDILEKTVHSVWYKSALSLAFLGGLFGAIKSLVSLAN